MMAKDKNNPQKFKSLTDLHRAFGLSKPVHPLISLIRGDGKQEEIKHPKGSHVLDFFKISFLQNLSGSVRYGQHHYDFDDGGMLFASPNQIIGESNVPTANAHFITLLIHPDFLLGHPLATKIKRYGFFSYSANEALHLSDKEKESIISLFKIIEEELNSRIDEFSQDVVIAQIDLLLNYANRFYKRQFITRKQAGNDRLQQLEEILDNYFNNENALQTGIPTVQYLSEQLHITPSYLSDMLRSLIGQNGQQYIQYRLIEKAKEKLSTTNLTVTEIAYGLGFEHPQSFSKLFKAKTDQSPLEFRALFN